MENIHYDFAEGIANSLYEAQLSDFDVLAVHSPEPDDEEENDDGEEEDKGSDENDPPLDENVVHSPVTTQTGGKPK